MSIQILMVLNRVIISSVSWWNFATSNGMVLSFSILLLMEVNKLFDWVFKLFYIFKGL